MTSPVARVEESGMKWKPISTLPNRSEARSKGSQTFSFSRVEKVEGYTIESRDVVLKEGVSLVKGVYVKGRYSCSMRQTRHFRHLLHREPHRAGSQALCRPCGSECYFHSTSTLLPLRMTTNGLHGLLTVSGPYVALSRLST